MINEVNRQLAPKKVGVDLTFDDLAKIKIISLSNKSLTGEVPPEIKNLVSLEKLLLYSNKLSGEIPAELGELTNLSELRLDYNQFTGKIPDGLGKDFVNCVTEQRTGWPNSFELIRKSNRNK